MNPEMLARLADTVSAQVAKAAEQWEAGELTDAEFQAVALAYIQAAQAQGITLADLAISTLLAAGALGLLPGPPELDRARASVEVIRAGKGVPGLAEIARVETRAEVLQTAQRASRRAMQGQGVTGWVRRLNAGACELCQDLAGPVLPVTAEMYHHKGCGCTQRPSERKSA